MQYKNAINVFFTVNKNMFFKISVESYYKRAPSGFIGMRGRRDDMYEPFEEKRKAPLGFIGMRGKKDLDVIQNMDTKRAPAFGFFGTRGKKLSRFVSTITVIKAYISSTFLLLERDFLV